MIENNKNDIKKQIIKRLMRKDVRSVAVAMHNSYDGDSLGSAVALEKILIKMGKKVDIIIQNKISSKYSKIIGSNRVNRIMVPYHGRKYDLLILVDCANPDRTVNNIFELSDFMIVIDHHFGCQPIGDIYLYEDVPACGMIIYNIIKMMEKENHDKNILDSDIINALYLSIRSDTNCFKNKNTDDNINDLTQNDSSQNDSVKNEFDTNSSNNNFVDEYDEEINNITDINKSVEMVDFWKNFEIKSNKQGYDCYSEKLDIDLDEQYKTVKDSGYKYSEFNFCIINTEEDSEIGYKPKKAN
jgi:nanoRNase/pAp phosphatase (c-di-AMP/oligoRNAs hydrolase)